MGIEHIHWLSPPNYIVNVKPVGPFKEDWQIEFKFDVLNGFDWNLFFNLTENFTVSTNTFGCWKHIFGLSNATLSSLKIMEWLLLTHWFNKPLCLQVRINHQYKPRSSPFNNFQLDAHQVQLGANFYLVSWCSHTSWESELEAGSYKSKI